MSGDSLYASNRQKKYTQYTTSISFPFLFMIAEPTWSSWDWNAGPDLCMLKSELCTWISNIIKFRVTDYCESLPEPPVMLIYLIKHGKYLMPCCLSLFLNTLQFNPNDYYCTTEALILCLWHNLNIVSNCNITLCCCTDDSSKSHCFCLNEHTDFFFKFCLIMVLQVRKLNDIYFFCL